MIFKGQGVSPHLQTTLDNMYVVWYTNIHMKSRDTKETSKARLQLLEVSGTLTNLLHCLIKIKSMTKGTVYIQKKKCGNKNCKCARGELHSTKVLSFSHKGKTRLISLTKYSIHELSIIKRQVRDYQKFRRARAKIVSSFKALLSEINSFEQELLIGLPAKKGGINARRKKQHSGNQKGIT